MNVRKSFMIIMIVALILIPATTALAQSQNNGLAQGQSKAAVCHVDGQGNYSPITIADPAMDAHLAHGDAQPGDAVPGNPGYNFSDDCRPVFAVITITADINRGGNPPGSDHGVESPASNLVADAQLWATEASGAQIAFVNPGGVRSDLMYLQSAGEGDGVVTFDEAFALQPFSNTLKTFPMTGAQIISVLEEQWQPAESSRPFLQLGVSEGFTYDLAKTIDAGELISITVSNVKLNNVILSPTDTFSVTVNSLLSDGGDNFGTFATITAPKLDGGNDFQALVNYLGTFSPIDPLLIIDRITEQTIPVIQ